MVEGSSIRCASEQRGTSREVCWRKLGHNGELHETVLLCAVVRRDLRLPGEAVLHLILRWPPFS